MPIRWDFQIISLSPFKTPPPKRTLGCFYFFPFFSHFLTQVLLGVLTLSKYKQKPILCLGLKTVKAAAFVFVLFIIIRAQQGSCSAMEGTPNQKQVTYEMV